MSMSRFNIFFIFICLFTVFSCKPKSKSLPEGFDYGKIENNAYSNRYFGMHIKLPADWEAVGTDGIKKSYEGVKEQIGEDYDKFVAELEKAEDVGSAILLTVRKYPLDSFVADGNNPSLAVVVENAKRLGDLSATQFLDRQKFLIKKNGIDASYADSYSTANIGGQEFKIMPIIQNVHGDPINQEYYVTRQKLFALTFILTFKNEEGRKELEKIMSTLNFQ